MLVLDVWLYGTSEWKRLLSETHFEEFLLCRRDIVYQCRPTRAAYHTSMVASTRVHGPYWFGILTQWPS